MESDQPGAIALQNLGIAALNDMQEKAMVAIQDHPNVILLAPTGSGKTVAFLLPILHLMQADKPGVQCLILSPTRELAIQIERVWQKMSTGFKVNTCYGGHPMQTEVNNLSQPPALLIGTPGRIQEHITRESVNLEGVRVLVLDEFDKSLSLGFQEQMAEIIKALPGLQKRILASATNKLKIPEFTGITNPKKLDYTLEAEKSTDGLSVKYILAHPRDKEKALFRLLYHLGPESSIIFCNQRDSVEQLVHDMDLLGIECGCYHGGLEQIEREKALVRFRNGSTLFLVASDLAARGLDIPAVKNVIHFELPQKLNDFVHRNGRTARMHAEGTAYLIISSEESLPVYLSEKPELLEVPENSAQSLASTWSTLYISGGKKDKLSKMDIVGFLSKKGNLQAGEIGLIEIMDHMSFVAVDRNCVKTLLTTIRNEKMKGQKYKIVVAR